MARIRTVKPEFFTSRTAVRLSYGARLTFLGLLTHCDDAGRCLMETRLIKAALWPLEDEVTPDTILGWIGELSGVQLVVCYRAPNGDQMLQIRNWAEHQKISHPRESKYPAPTEEDMQREGLGISTGTLPEDSVKLPGSLRVGKERKGRERKGTGNAGADAPGDAVFEEAWLAYPHRPGDSRAIALKAWKSRLKEGASPEAMLAGVKAYAAHCRREGTEPRYTKMAATFFGPGKHWEADYGTTGTVEDGWNPDGTIRTYTPDGHSFTKAFLSTAGQRARG